MTPVKLEPVAPLSRVKHSTTEPLHSPDLGYALGKIWNNKIVQLEFYDTVKIDKTKVLMENGSLMQVKVYQNAPLGAFCNTFDLN